MLTGHYPSLHGVSQTTGVAKEAFDSDMFWLGRNTLPTMGNYFREAGYRTYYKGKWHISQADITVPGTHQDLPSYNPVNGVPDRQKSALYKHADPLDSYGFSGWIGPEPHGKNPRNSASSAAYGVSGRDVVYAAEAAQLLAALEQQKQSGHAAAPWLIVASFVNPHGIVLYGDLTEHLPAFHFDADGTPPIPPPPSMNESLHTKPRCQASYRHIYPRALQQITNEPFYRKLYYRLQRKADQAMHRVFEALTRSSMYDNTIVIFTSDHGDLLGAHGGLHQKWYTAYEEALHVPLIIHSKRLFPSYVSCHALTSHVDLLPTMLGLAGIDLGAVEERLRAKFSEVRPFVGRDLTSAFLGGAALVDEPIYFMTDDDITRGQHQTNTLGVPYPAVIQPNHIETVIAVLRSHDRQETWKLSRYFDNRDFWSQPGAKDEIVQPGHPASRMPVKSVKTIPVQEEYGLYNVTADHLELRNLAHPAFASPQTLPVLQLMIRLLEEQRQAKRLRPAAPGGN